MGDSRRQCPLCGDSSVSERARFCPKCGRVLAGEALPGIVRDRWDRRPDDLAIRFDLQDLVGGLNTEWVVEAGTNALLLVDGQVHDTLPPGRHTLSRLRERIGRLVRLQSPQSVTVLITDIGPVELEYRRSTLFTRDPLAVDLSLRLVVEVSLPGLFLISLLKTRRVFTLTDLQSLLAAEVDTLVVDWASMQTAADLLGDARLKDDLALSLEEGLHRKLEMHGIVLRDVRAIRFEMATEDDRRRREAALLQNRASADLDQQMVDQKAEARLAAETAALRHEQQHAAIEDERALRDVEAEERRAALFARLRAAVTADRMDEVRSEADFEAFLDDVDRQRLLRDKEREDMVRGWQQERDDHERARMHFLARLDLAHEHALQQAALRQRVDLSTQELDLELRLQAMRAEAEQRLRLQLVDGDLERRRKQETFERERRQAERAQATQDQLSDIALARRVVEELAWPAKERRLREQLEREAHTQKLRLEEARVSNELELQRERIQHAHEMERWDRLTTMTTEALIAVTGDERSRLLAELKRAESLRGFSDEQILSLASQRTPEFVQALRVTYESIATGRATPEAAVLFEGLLARQGRPGPGRPTEPKEASARVCQRCGAPARPIGVFCRSCGNKLATNQSG